MDSALLGSDEPSDKPRLPCGAVIVYKEGDHVAFHHLFSFLRNYFQITDKDLTPETVMSGAGDARFPICWFGDMEVDFKQLLQATKPDLLIGEWIRVGFLDEHLEIFREYKKYLDDDPSTDDELKAFFSEMEEKHFGAPGHLN